MLLMIAIAGFDLDRQLASALFYDPATARWVGAHTLWAERLIHTGGRDLVRLIALGAVAVLAGGCFRGTLRPWRRDAAFAILAILLSTGLVGLLKHLTNVDCPWSLVGYGGTNPYVAPFGDRPDGLPEATCFPGAHSSSGFALACFYFLLRDRSSRLARVALAASLGLGAVFAFGQEARGAHFLSHDLTSAALVWATQLALYRVMLRRGSERAIDLALQHRLTG
jgi:membrane-associated PAP2 superfamily phosphatase